MGLHLGMQQSFSTPFIVRITDKVMVKMIITLIFGAYHVSQRYLVAKITTASKVYYIEIAATPTYDDKPVKILVEIMESDILQTGMIELNADIFKETLEKEGKIALYGILFDTGKTDIKKASLKEIELVSTYLKQHPKAHIYIVGHTDDGWKFW